LVSPLVKHYKVDINNLKALEEVFESEKNIKAIFHFAALIAVDESVAFPLKYMQTNTFGTMNLLKCAEKHNIKNFIFSSTAAVYGEGKGGEAITEDTTPLPINPYGDSKLAAESMIRA
jgi:UDP-glucose 4-epimerase